jgi:2-iminobutanoate/2-iminopropanoate deaminase
MIPIDPKTGEMLTGDFASEVRLVLENLKAVISAAGMDLSNVLKTTVYLRDMGQFAEFNGIYAGYFGEDPPARETVQPARLPRDASIEISAICGK